MAHYLDFAKYLLCPLSRENELLLITKLVILAPPLRSVYSSLIILRNRFDMLRVPFEYHWLWSWHTLYHRWNDDNLLPIHKDQSKLSARLQFCLVWVNIFAKQSHITSEIPIHEIKGDYFMENVRTVLTHELSENDRVRAAIKSAIDQLVNQNRRKYSVPCYNVFISHTEIWFFVWCLVDKLISNKY